MREQGVNGALAGLAAVLQGGLQIGGQLVRAQLAHRGGQQPQHLLMHLDSHPLRDKQGHEHPRQAAACWQRSL